MTATAFLTEQDPPNTTLKPTLSSTMAGKKGKTETKKREYSSAAFGWAVLLDYVVLVSSQCFHWMKWVGESKTGHHWNWSDPESRRGGGGRISRGGARPPVSPPAWAAKPDRLTLNKPRTWYSLDNHEHILRPAWLTQHGTLNLSASIAVSRFGLAVRRYWGSVVSGRTASAVRYRFAALLSLQKGCGLWTLSKLWHCPSLPTETLIWLSSLPILMQKSFWWWWWWWVDA